MAGNEGGQARKHHYVPQCYLKGFARNRSKKSQLYVVDSSVKRAFVTTPLNVAAERDFNRIEVDGEDPNLIESSYAEFEANLAPALVRMDAKGDFPDDADRALILELVALLAVRNPGRRKAMRKFKEETTRRLMELAVANRERWESQRQKAVEAGVEGATDLSFEEVREFVERGDFTIGVPTTEHVEQELKSLTTVYNLLHRRSWVVVRAPPRLRRLRDFGSSCRAILGRRGYGGRVLLAWIRRAGNNRILSGLGQTTIHHRPEERS
jgi:hypothetical protein